MPAPSPSLSTQFLKVKQSFLIHPDWDAETHRSYMINDEFYENVVSTIEIDGWLCWLREEEDNA